MNPKQILRTFLGVPLTILAFIFIGKIFFDNRLLIGSSLTHLNTILFSLGIFSFSVFFVIKSIVWIMILKNRGFTPPAKKLLYDYSLAEIKRYIPGSIFAFIGRVNSHESVIPKRETLKGIGIEAVILVASSATIGIPALIFLTSNYLPQIAIGIITFLVLVGLLTLLINSKSRKIIFQYFDTYLMFVLAWVFYGLGCYLTAISFTFLPVTSFLSILSFFVLAWLCGYLLFVAPMGLGVRELTITGFLSFFIPFPIATTVALLTRINMILGEMLYFVVLLIINKIKQKIPISSNNYYSVIICIVATLYFVYFSAFTILRNDKFLSGRFDLGNMTQTVWNTAHGNFFQLTNPDGTEIISRLGVHSDFILILFAPFYYLWSSPSVLLIGQSLILAIGGFFVYFLAIDILRNKKLALALGVSYYLNFWLHEQNIFDFHAVSLSTTLLLGAFYFLNKNRYLAFTVLALLAASTKENIFLVISFFGLYMMLKKRLYWQGGFFMLITISAFFFLSSVAIPQARGEAHFALESYSYLGDSTANVAKNIFLKPQIVFNQIANFSTLQYLNYHLLPTGYLALLSPFYLIFTLPELAIYLLSTNYGYRSYEYHFGAAIIPFVYISTIFSLKLLSKKFRNYKILTGAFYYVLFFAFYSAYMYSPLIGMRNQDTQPFSIANADVISDYLKLIPPKSSVVASNNLGAHLSHREYIFAMPYGLSETEFVVLFHENPKMVALIDFQNYESWIQDPKNDFYLLKKKIKESCTLCKP